MGSDSPMWDHGAWPHVFFATHCRQYERQKCWENALNTSHVICLGTHFHQIEKRRDMSSEETCATQRRLWLSHDDVKTMYQAISRILLARTCLSVTSYLVQVVGVPRSLFISCFQDRSKSLDIASWM